MGLTLAEIKDLVSFGQQIGLQQLQTEGLVVVYGAPRVEQVPMPTDGHTDEAQAILAHYSAVGRAQLKAAR